MLDPEDIQYVLDADIRSYKQKKMTEIRVFEECGWIFPNNGSYRYSYEFSCCSW